MNKVELIGRLTRDPDVYVRQEPPQDKITARYTLAVDRRYTNQDGSRDADFITCVAFGKTAEFAEKYLKKGIKIAVVGSIRTGSYEKDGRKIYTTDVLVEEHEFCENKGAAGGNNGGGERGAATAAAGADNDGFMDMPDGINEELPFA